MIYQGQELETIAALTAERDRLRIQLEAMHQPVPKTEWELLVAERDALQAETHRLKAIYESAVKGRAGFRAALKKANDQVQTLQSRVDYLEAWRETAKETLDCRTCRHHTTATGGCISVLKCIEGSAYQRAGFRQCWEKA